MSTPDTERLTFRELAVSDAAFVCELLTDANGCELLLYALEAHAQHDANA